MKRNKMTRQGRSRNSVSYCITFLPLALLFLIALSTEIITKKPASYPNEKLQENNDFDFWLGEWDITWGPGVTGLNTVTKDLNGHVISENFRDMQGNFMGKSFTVYNKIKKQWEQTWVDNTGQYITRGGGFKDGVMKLENEFMDENGRTIKRQLSFFNITADSLECLWERSLDGGKTWVPIVHIFYKRKK